LLQLRLWTMGAGLVAHFPKMDHQPRPHGPQAVFSLFYDDTDIQFVKTETGGDIFGMISIIKEDSFGILGNVKTEGKWLYSQLFVI